MVYSSLLHRDDISEEEAKKVLTDAMRVMLYRDARTINSIQVLDLNSAIFLHPCFPAPYLLLSKVFNRLRASRLAELRFQIPLSWILRGHMVRRLDQTTSTEIGNKAKKCGSTKPLYCQSAFFFKGAFIHCYSCLGMYDVTEH